MAYRYVLAQRMVLYSILSLALSPCMIVCAAEAELDRKGNAGKIELPLNRSVGQRLSDFKLNDVITGRPVSLYGFMGKKAVVVVFLGNDCPVGNLYVPRLIELNKAYRGKGVIFLGINSNVHESVTEVANYVRQNGIDFPVLKDVSNKVSDAALVERTCETLVLDGFARIRYRGAIDDQYLQGKSKSGPQHNFVRDALDALVADKPVTITSSKVAGCLIDRIEPQVAESNRGPRIRSAPKEMVAAFATKVAEPAIKPHNVTYASDVAAIIQNKCQNCHRPGQVGPFALESYDDVRKHAAMIREVVEDRRMPPWHADPRYGHFSNDRSLNSKSMRRSWPGSIKGRRLVIPRCCPRRLGTPISGRSASLIL